MSLVTAKNYSHDSSSLSTKSLCSICAAAPRLVSSSLSPVIEILHGDTSLLSRLRTAEGQRRQTSTAAGLHAAHTRLSSLSKYSITSSRFEPYRTLPASPSVLSRCPSPTLVVGPYIARLSLACSSSSSENAECINCSRSRIFFGWEFRGSLGTGKHLLRHEQRFQTLAELHITGQQFLLLGPQRTPHPTLCS